MTAGGHFSLSFEILSDDTILDRVFPNISATSCSSEYHYNNILLCYHNSILLCYYNGML